MEPENEPPGRSVMDGDERRTVWLACLAAATIVFIFAGLCVCIVLSHQSDERRMSNMVDSCVKADKLWIDNNCVPSGK